MATVFPVPLTWARRALSAAVAVHDAPAITRCWIKETTP
jgi:hypothetical protein